MALGGKRTGTPQTPTTTTDGSVNTTAREVQFQSSDGLVTYARPCVVTNTDGTNVLYVKVNDTSATAADFLVSVPVLGHVDVSFEGRLNVQNLSLWYAAGDLDTALVRGWTAREN